MGAAHHHHEPHDDHDHPQGDHDHASHGDHEGHAHDHGHHHAPKDFGRAFAVGIALQTAFVATEVVVGALAGSLAVLADAGHNISDVLALALAWGASHLGKRGPSKGRTYGLRSASILAALANGLTLVFVNGAVAWEAIGRLREPEAVAAMPMIFVSLGGVVVNGFCAWVFSRGSEGDVNIRAAFLHLVSDAAVAGGVAVAGVAIYFTGWRWLDPVASMFVAVVVMWSTWSLLRRALDLAMHAVPHGLDEAKVETWLRARPGIVEVHDLHIWGMSTTETAMTVHLAVAAMPSDGLVCRIDADLRKAFPKIHHVTIQIEPGGTECALASPHTV
jgi:cobalt-zinc-cadmium efflux system protein